MKRIFAAILVFTFAAAILCACGENGSSETENKTSGSSAVESAASDNSETSETKTAESGASKVEAAMGEFEGNWVCVIDTSEALGYTKITLSFSSGSFEMVMAGDELEEVSVGTCEEGDGGTLVCYCTKISTRNISDGTVKDEMSVTESEREDAKMTVEMLENGHIAATNYNGSTLEFEKK